MKPHTIPYKINFCDNSLFSLCTCAEEKRRSQKKLGKNAADVKLIWNFIVVSEAATGGVLWEKMFLENAQKSQTSGLQL